MISCYARANRPIISGWNGRQRVVFRALLQLFLKISTKHLMSFQIRSSCTWESTKDPLLRTESTYQELFHAEPSHQFRGPLRTELDLPHPVVAVDLADPPEHRLPCQFGHGRRCRPANRNPPESTNQRHGHGYAQYPELDLAAANRRRRSG